MTKRNNILAIMKKEFRRFFLDRRMVLTILLPGIMIYTIYSLMGGAFVSGMMEETTNYRVAVERGNLPASMEAMLKPSAEAAGLTVNYVYDVEDPRAAVREEEVDVYVRFPENFDEAVTTYDPANGKPAPEVKIYYNSASTASQAAYSFLVSVLNAYESSVSNCMDINVSPDEVYDMAAPEALTGMLLSMIMPMLLITLTFSGCMAMTTEAIAGEKERGTIATLLVTPVKRSELAIGKIAALSVISLLAGFSSFLGLLLSLPKLMGSGDMEGAGLIDASVYTAVDYGMVLAVILSTVVLFVSILAVISALANSVKEANGFVSPLVLVVTLIGVSGMFANPTSSATTFLIPVYNSVQCIGRIFSMSYEPLQILLTALANLATSAIFVFILTQMFKSERFMFKK